MARFVPAGWSEADVLRELIDGPARAFVPFPELEVVERPDFARLTCALFPSGGFNGVSRMKVADDVADRLIDETLADYRRRGLRFRWPVMPDASPADLASRLAARGLASHEVVAMARATAVAAPASGCSVELVDETNVDLFTRVMAEGWSAPAGPLERYHRLTLRAPGRPQRLFLARVDGEPAGVASAMFFERSMYLLGGVVLERFRKRGVYDALTRARLAMAHENGLPLATTHAMAATSAPLLARRGFDEWFRFPSFSG
ncbi:MAG: GNAT family N-acetyltransferase [Myxococcota bacterium]